MSSAVRFFCVCPSCGKLLEIYYFCRANLGIVKTARKSGTCIIMVGGDTEPLTWFNFVYNRLIIMEIEGTLIQKLAVQSGKSARGDWAKQDFVIEYQEGNFPTKACFNVWGADKVKELEQFQIGDKIKLSFNVSSREYNGKWYTDLKAWRISKAGAPAAGNYAQAPSGYQQSAPASYDMPAGFAPSSVPQPSAPAPTFDDMPGDDLPF